jgi:nicotinate phosphoribosyltransferase
MANFIVQKRHCEVPVRYEFVNRSNVKLKEYIDIEELIFQLNCVKQLKFSDEDISFLRKQEFPDNFLTKLKELKLDDVRVEQLGDDFSIVVDGTWFNSIFWETMILSIVNELYFIGFLNKLGLYQAVVENIFVKNISNKAKKIRENNIRFVEFGTRRRATRFFQELMISEMKNLVGDKMLGTSNTLFAKELKLKPIGTMAHELFMAYSGIYRDKLKESHNMVIRDWQDVYNDRLSIVLNDTYGSDFFWDDFTQEQANHWSGWREDSGDVFERIKQGICALKKKGVDAKKKTCIPSDSLDVDKVIKIQNEFCEQVNLIYGIGTNLSFDFGDIVKPIPIVVKMTEANGKGLVKLSNNIEKAIGKKEDIDLFKRTFCYSNSYSERCVS